MMTYLRWYHGKREMALVLSRVLRTISTIVSCSGAGGKARVYGRIKTSESRIWKTRQLHGARILDSVGVRVIVGEISECYSVIRDVHSCFQWLGSEFDDYIQHPKVNGYRSLHTTILSPRGYPVELQVRTQHMHAVAEAGSATHRIYKLLATTPAPTLPSPILDAAIRSRVHKHPVAVVPRHVGLDSVTGGISLPDMRILLGT